MSKIVSVLILSCLLSACAVVDLAAHGMKEYEESRSRKNAEMTPEAPPSPPEARDGEAVPSPVPGAVPPREAVGSEPLQ